jgi:hypothetical protein
MAAVPPLRLRSGQALSQKTRKDGHPPFAVFVGYFLFDTLQAYLETVESKIHKIEKARMPVRALNFLGLTCFLYIIRLGLRSHFGIGSPSNLA